MQSRKVSLFTREWIEIIERFEIEIISKSVSLFTREWIEIYRTRTEYDDLPVSLFTREWIEIARDKWLRLLYLSPSLRGSGLK